MQRTSGVIELGQLPKEMSWLLNLSISRMQSTASKHPGAHGGHNPRGTLQFPPLPSLSHSERTLHACLKRSTCRMPTPQIQPSVSSQRTARKVSGFQLPRSALMARSPLPSHFAGLLLSHSVETSVSPPSVSSARATKRIRACSYS